MDTVDINNIKAVDLSPIDSRRIYAVGTDSGDWRSDRLFVSVDRGQNFTLSPLDGVTSRAGRTFNSVLADPRDPMSVWIAATGPISEGGGVYVSRDGGGRFSPLHEGLPAGEFFETDIWGIGRELAVGRDRTVLALSKRQGVILALEPGQSRWRSVPSPTPTPGEMYEVASSPHVERLWFVVNRSNGLWRSDNAGGNWNQVLPGQVRTVVADRARAGRWVAGTDKGVLLSEDHGLNWRLLDTSLPNLVRPTVGFAGDRVLAGTLGNGLFWIPLTTSAANPIVAAPISAPPYPDLVVTDIRPVPANYVPGTTIRYAITVRNQGSTATGPFWLGVTADVNGQPADWGGFNANLGAGATTTVTTNDGSIAPNGSFRASALVDFPFYVVESSESNNTFEVTLGGSNMPDLVVDSVEMSPANAAPGASVVYRITVRNRGLVNTGPFWLGATVNVNGNYADWGGFNANLVAGGSVVLVTRGVNVKAPAFGATAEAFVDFPNYVNESNENNNRRTVISVKLLSASSP